MKRKLPTPRAEYLGPTAARLMMSDATEYHVWATFGGTANPFAQVVQVVRVATHEVPNSKWVEFALVPEAVTLTGSPLYAVPTIADEKIKCEWSDFLRLTRWRKNVGDLTPREQARIARIEVLPVAEYPVRLVAVDDPIRKQGKV